MSSEVFRRWMVACALAIASSTATAKAPDCTKASAWPGSMTVVHLKNASVITNEALDLSRTTVQRLASEPIGKDRFRQIHRVTMFTLTGEQIVAIAVGDVSTTECSASGVDVYLVSRVLGDYSKQP